VSLIGMSYVNQVVDKVYLINLDRDTERLKNMTEQLTRLNIELPGFQRFSDLK
jgi:GR25 family glycosyltransferase involved in LPS biosynthesis